MTQVRISGRDTTCGKAILMDESQTGRTTCRFAVVLNKAIEPGTALNACAHMTATLVARADSETRKHIRLAEQLTDEPLLAEFGHVLFSAGTCVSSACSSRADGESVQGDSSRSSVDMARAAC